MNGHDQLEINDNDEKKDFKLENNEDRVLYDIMEDHENQEAMEEEDNKDIKIEVNEEATDKDGFNYYSGIHNYHINSFFFNFSF